ncbi:MAG: acyl-CoA dehydrogenase family protein [Pseudomonadota bacterium]
MEQETLDQIGQELERILSDAALEAIDQAEGRGSEAEALWAMLCDNGYSLLAASEEHGGFGGSLADAASLAQLCAGHALALPLADTMLVAGVLSRAGITPSRGASALADPIAADTPIAHAMQAEEVLLLGGGRLKLSKLDPRALAPQNRSEDGAAILTEPLIDEIGSTPAPNWLTPLTLRALGALIRSAQMAGAMQGALDLTLEYTQGREQFGRPLAKFQAVQHHLSDIACETAASIAAVELASDALRADPECSDATIEEIAIAKIRCGEAASKVAAAAHQAHGAMGFTREYALGRFTRRLWQWQDEFGSESEWSAWLGHRVLSDAEPALWPRISRAI